MEESVMRKSLVFLGLVGLAACQPKPAVMTDAQKAALGDSVKAVAMAMVDQMNKGGPSAGMAMYASTGGHFTNNGVMMTDVAAMKKMNDDMSGMMTSMQIKPEKVDATVLGPDAVVLNSPYSMTMTMKSGKEVTGKGVWTGVMQRQGTTWKLITEHISDVNAEDMMKAMMAPAPKTAAKKTAAPAKKTTSTKSTTTKKK
jgi:ketosteroid isomerase-like protein